MMIELSCHKNEWRRTFNDFKSEIIRISKNIVIDVQHIGSTAIDNVKAKDIIDVQIGISSFDQMDLLQPLLESLNLEPVNTAQQDHVPFHEVDYFETGWEKRLFKGEYNGQPFNIHIRIFNSLNWNFALNFKKHLSENQQARYAYTQFKERLAQTNITIEEYCMIKDSVIDLLSLQFKR